MDGSSHRRPQHGCLGSAFNCETVSVETTNGHKGLKLTYLNVVVAEEMRAISTWSHSAQEHRIHLCRWSKDTMVDIGSG